MLLISLTLASQEAGFLDLLNQTIQPRQTESASATASVVSVGAGDREATQPPPQLLRITLSKLERSEYKIDQDLIYEVKLENLSSRPIQIPWTASPRDIEPARQGPYEYQMARLTPTLVDSSGQLETLEPAIIFGSDAAGTTRVIAPNQWVRIRAKSRLSWHNQGSTSSPSAEPQAVRVGATWSLYRVSFAEHNGRYHETFVPTDEECRSTNTIAIQIGASKDGRTPE